MLEEHDQQQLIQSFLLDSQYKETTVFSIHWVTFTYLSNIKRSLLNFWPLYCDQKPYLEPESREIMSKRFLKNSSRCPNFPKHPPT